MLDGALTLQAVRADVVIGGFDGEVLRRNKLAGQRTEHDHAEPVLHRMSSSALAREGAAASLAPCENKPGSQFLSVRTTEAGVMRSVVVECADGVGHLRLNRADALNALDVQFCKEIDASLLALDARDDVRSILISSSLRHFSAGADIREMLDMSAEQAEATGFTGCVSAPSQIRKPLIVAVRGLAAGGGCELVEMCDIVVAAASARFSHPEITLAAMPGAGGTQRLARVVGKHLAMDLLLTGRALSADEALAAGLVSRVVADEALETTAMSIARQVASYSSPVACRIKASVNEAQVQLEAGLALERSLFHACFSEQDFREGLRAFIEKRAPRFGHR